MKKGFSYYNIDTDRYQNIRIKRLKKDCGCMGIAVYDYILCEIYRVRGCVLEWDANTAFDVADYFGLKESQVAEIVSYCCAVGLFNKDLLTNGGVLTSESIQRRYTEMSKRAKRNDYEIPGKWIILPEKSDEIPEKTVEPPEETDRVKESKGKKSKEEKEKELLAARAATLKREKEFYETLVPYVDKYGKDMIRDFFDYWSEKNKQQNKMRFEQQGTWETSKRLATWANRDKEFKPSQTTEETKKYKVL